MLTRSYAGLLALVMAIGACGDPPPDPRRQRYQADQARCDSLSQDKSARKSCMTYRGWPDGKFR
jgi:hypothetical protein